MKQILKWIAILALMAAAAYMFGLMREQARQDMLAKKKQRIQESADYAIQRGRESREVLIHYQQVVPIVAADNECQESVTHLAFSLFDWEPDPDFDYSSIRQLRNLRFIFFYCSDSDPVLRAAAGMESIEELSFELCGSSDEGIQLLTTFPNLKKVSFEQVMSQEKIDKLKELLPEVELNTPAMDELETDR